MLQRILGIVITSAIAISCQVFAFEVPLHDQYITDLADVLSYGQEEDLEVSMYKIWQNHDVEGAVLLVPTLSGETIEAASLQVAEERGVGDAEKDNGFIIFAAINDRSIRIEVGYGLEYLLTDGVTKRLLDTNIPPYFRQGDYAGGIQAVLDDINKILSGDIDIATFDTQSVDTYSQYDNSDEQFAIISIFSFIIFIVGLGLMMEFVVTDPKYNNKQKTQAQLDGKTKPYVNLHGWKNFGLIASICALILFFFTTLIFASILASLVSLFLALWIALQEGGTSSSGRGSSSRSSSRSSRSSPSSSSRSSSSRSSGSSFGGFSGGSFGGGGSSSSR